MSADDLGVIELTHTPPIQTFFRTPYQCFIFASWSFFFCTPESRASIACERMDPCPSVFGLPCFSCLTWQKEELGIAGYGVSVTTLEEVFLRVGHGSDEVSIQYLAKIHVSGTLLQVLSSTSRRSHVFACCTTGRLRRGHYFVTIISSFRKREHVVSTSFECCTTVRATLS